MTGVYPPIETGNAAPAHGRGLCPLDQGLREFPW
jgi:hypothetical protein